MTRQNSLLTFPSSRGRVAGILAAALLALCSAPQAALADRPPVPDARARFKEGNRLFDRGEFHAALKAFQAAHRVSGNPKVYLNIALTHSRLKNAAGEARNLDLFLLSVEPGSFRERVLLFRQRLRSLRQNLGSVTVTGKRPGSTVTIGSRYVGKIPLGARIYLEPGSHGVAVEKHGYLGYFKPVRLGPGAHAAVEARLLVRQQQDHEQPGSPTAAVRRPAAKKKAMVVYLGAAHGVEPSSAKPLVGSFSSIFKGRVRGVEAVTRAQLAPLHGGALSRVISACKHDVCVRDALTKYRISASVFIRRTRVDKQRCRLGVLAIHKAEVVHASSSVVPCTAKELIAATILKAEACAGKFRQLLKQVAPPPRPSKKDLSKLRFAKLAEPDPSVCKVPRKRIVPVDFASKPPGARVTVDGKHCCARTPCRRLVPAGPRDVVFSWQNKKRRRTIWAGGPGQPVRLSPLSKDPVTVNRWFGMNIGPGMILYDGDELFSTTFDLLIGTLHWRNVYWTMVELKLPVSVGFAGLATRIGGRIALSDDRRHEVRGGAAFGFGVWPVVRDLSAGATITPHLQYVYNANAGSLGIGIDAHFFLSTLGGTLVPGGSLYFLWMI